MAAKRSDEIADEDEVLRDHCEREDCFYEPEDVRECRVWEEPLLEEHEESGDETACHHAICVEEGELVVLRD